LNKGKTAVLHDLQVIPVVSIKYFKDAILPNLPNINIADIRDSLIKSSLWTKDEGWVCFHSESSEAFDPEQNTRPKPSKDPRPEEAIFEGVNQIFDDVITAASQLSSTLELNSKPSKSPSSHRLDTSCPDAYLLLKQRKSIPKDLTDDQDSWDDIAISFEFKKCAGSADHISISLCMSPNYTPTDLPLYQNQQQIVWNLHTIMREDPCRCSTFGITIENTEVHLWFTCCTTTVVSELFNLFTVRPTILLIPDETNHLLAVYLPRMWMMSSTCFAPWLLPMMSSLGGIQPYDKY
jgi:hypothetical protein